MPKLVKEVSDGQSFSRSAEGGAIADTLTRVFRVILETPGEYLDIQQACGVYIGDVAPSNPGLFCQSFSASFENNSRVTVLCTFQYATNSSSPENSPPQSPDVRPAEWSISSALVEAPAWYWKPEEGPDAGRDVAPANVVGDLYDGITKLEPVITISITQFETADPTYRLLDVGKINEDDLVLGSYLSCEPYTVMFRGITKKPAIEPFGANVVSGYSCTYEFLYKPNFVGGEFNEKLGWDILVPQSGMNVICFDPDGGQDQPNPMADPLGQPLQWEEGSLGTKVKANPYTLPKGLRSGTKAQAMVAIPAHADGGFSQKPASSPIPLNNDGSPRRSSAKPKVMLKRYRLYQEMSFSDFGLRLY